MNPEFAELIDACLDDRLTVEQAAELNRRVQDDPQFARAFAEALFLHDRLFDLARTGNSFGLPSNSGHETRRMQLAPTLARKIRFAGLIAASIVTLLLTTWWNAGQTLNAATEIDRLLARIDMKSDRRLEIRNLDPGTEPKNDRQPPIDGATLYVRSPDRYVLVRTYPDGRRFLTGSDGQTSWAVPPDGPVRVSHDAERFRGPVPGHQHGLPFVDVRGDLNAFRSSYELAGPRLKAGGMRTIAGTRKRGVARGPRSFEMTYDPVSGTIRQMIFDGLPQARGGPRRVAVELTDSSPLPERFFGHEFHHEIDRQVEEED
jgi:hypothetical protein